MKKAEFNITIEELSERYKNYQHQVELRTLDNSPFIVQLEALTITSDETGKIITHNSNYPTQFTQKAVDEILTMTFKNGNGDVVIPKVYSRVQWYEERLNDLTETIKQLEPLLIL